jgi:hypothetical protein
MNRQQKMGDEAWPGDDSRKRNGTRFASICPTRRRPPAVAAHAWRIGAVSRVSSGCSGPAPSGASGQSHRAAPAPAGGDSSSGKRAGASSSTGAPSWPSSTTGRSSGGMSAAPRAALSPPTRGAQRRHDETWQGHNVDGGGRWRGTLRWEQSLDAASPAAVTLLEMTLETVAVGRPGQPGRPRKRPARLIADRGCDSQPLRARLARRGIEPIIPARRHHKHATHQDGRKRRRYRRRWMVERSHPYYSYPDLCLVSDSWPERIITAHHCRGQVPASGRGRARERMSTSGLPPRPESPAGSSRCGCGCPRRLANASGGCAASCWSTR